MPSSAEYIPRLVDRELKDMLKTMGGVVIEGPRAWGKTVTGRHHSQSEVLLDVDANARRLIGLNPRLVLQSPAPRLIDEWQLEPEVWNHIRREIDERQDAGQFIL